MENHCPIISTAFTNVSTYWGPSVQTHTSMGDISDTQSPQEPREKHSGNRHTTLLPHYQRRQFTFLVSESCLFFFFHFIKFDIRNICHTSHFLWFLTSSGHLAINGSILKTKQTRKQTLWSWSKPFSSYEMIIWFLALNLSSDWVVYVGPSLFPSSCRHSILVTAGLWAHPSLRPQHGNA